MKRLLILIALIASFSTTARQKPNLDVILATLGDSTVQEYVACQITDVEQTEKRGFLRRNPICELDSNHGVIKVLKYSQDDLTHKIYLTVNDQLKITAKLEQSGCPTNYLVTYRYIRAGKHASSADRRVFYWSVN